MTAQTDAHAATVQWIAVVTYTGSTPPSSVTVPYQLINYGSASLTLAGMTTPIGTGRAYGSVANALANTGTISRGTTEMNSHLYAGPLTQSKSPQISVAHWEQTGSNTYKATVVLESSTLTTQAQISAVAPPPPPGLEPDAIPDDQAFGSAQQSIQSSPN